MVAALRNQFRFRFIRLPLPLSRTVADWSVAWWRHPDTSLVDDEVLDCRNHLKKLFDRTGVSFDPASASSLAGVSPGSGVIKRNISISQVNFKVSVFGITYYSPNYT
jgi:hypothetical protein